MQPSCSYQATQIRIILLAHANVCPHSSLLLVPNSNPKERAENESICSPHCSWRPGPFILHFGCLPHKQTTAGLQAPSASRDYLPVNPNLPRQDPTFMSAFAGLIQPPFARFGGEITDWILVTDGQQELRRETASPIGGLRSCWFV